MAAVSVLILPKFMCKVLTSLMICVRASATRLSLLSCRITLHRRTARLPRPPISSASFISIRRWITPTLFDSTFRTYIDVQDSSSALPALRLDAWILCARPVRVCASSSGPRTGDRCSELNRHPDSFSARSGKRDSAALAHSHRYSYPDRHSYSHASASYRHLHARADGCAGYSRPRPSSDAIYVLCQA